jgi:hypothetical protein
LRKDELNTGLGWAPQNTDPGLPAHSLRACETCRNLLNKNLQSGKET